MWLIYLVGAIIMYILKLILFQLKFFVINYDIVYCGRDVVKILLVFLDEDVVSVFIRNKVEFLYNDESIVFYSGLFVFIFFRYVIRELCVKVLI